MSYIYGLIDIDNFYSYNLKNSFEQGNELLKNLEIRLVESLNPIEWRKLDSDEFLFSLHGNFIENRILITEALKRINREFKINLSIGIKESISECTFKELIFTLKSSLLIAKQNGKNIICVE